MNIYTMGFYTVSVFLTGSWFVFAARDFDKSNVLSERNNYRFYITIFMYVLTGIVAILTFRF